MILLDYDILECQRCGTICKPVNVLKNGSVRYETHLCNFKGLEIFPKKRSFKININGDLVE